MNQRERIIASFKIATTFVTRGHSAFIAPAVHVLIYTGPACRCVVFHRRGSCEDNPDKRLRRADYSSDFRRWGSDRRRSHGIGGDELSIRCGGPIGGITVSDSARYPTPLINPE